MKNPLLQLAALTAMSLALASPGRAAPIYSQTLNLNGDGGAFSYPLQQLADAFQLTANAKLQSLDWYGDNILNSFPAAVTFSINLYQDVSGLPATTAFASETVTAAATDTGISEPDFPRGTEEIFKFDANLATGISLNANTTYWLSILDQTPPTLPPDNVGGTFRWANGTSSWSGDPDNACCSPSSWSDIGPPRQQAAYDLNPTAMPEPAGMGLLGAALAAFLWLLRRRAPLFSALDRV